MANRITTLSTAAALVLAALGSSANAADAGFVNSSKTIGAMSAETRGVATGTAHIRSQGGFVTAGAAQWLAASPSATASDAAFNGSKTVGALASETRGLASNAAQVRSQGGALTAGAVQWLAASPTATTSDVAFNGSKTVGALASETRGLASNAAQVRSQGGALTAGAVQWIAAPAVDVRAESGAVYGSGSIGAMNSESRGRAISAADVLRQGAGVTAGAARWVSAPAIR